MIKYKDDTYIIVSRTTIICVRNQFCEKIQIQRWFGKNSPFTNYSRAIIG